MSTASPRETAEIRRRHKRQLSLLKVVLHYANRVEKMREEGLAYMDRMYSPHLRTGNVLEAQYGDFARRIQMLSPTIEELIRYHSQLLTHGDFDPKTKLKIQAVLLDLETAYPGLRTYYEFFKRYIRK